MKSGTYRDAWFGPAYFEHWEPYLAAAGIELIDRVEAAWGAPRHGGRVLDIGAGTGLLTAEAGRRWPEARLIAVDPAEAMLEVIRARLREEAAGKRTELVAAPADALPLPDASVDLAVSSFVLQLVEDRVAALREARRVLAPGGGLGYVTWLARDAAFLPGQAVDEALGGPSDTDWSGGAPRAGDVPSLEEAERELVEAGFREIVIAASDHRYDWSPDLYLRYVEGCRNARSFAALDDTGRAKLRARLRRALQRLPEDAFLSRASVVFALGRRPA